jgi:hypothetical protein
LRAAHHTTLYGSLTSSYYYRGFSFLAWHRQSDRAENSSNTRSLARAARACGFRHGRGQRLEPQWPERRRAVPVLPSRPPGASAACRRPVGDNAEAGSVLAASPGRCSGHAFGLFADRTPSSSRRVKNKVSP